MATVTVCNDFGVPKNKVRHCFYFFPVALPWSDGPDAVILVLTIWTFVSKEMSLLFNTLSRFVTAFLPRSKHLLISWLQSPSAVILEPKKNSQSIINEVVFVMGKWQKLLLENYSSLG